MGALVHGPSRCLGLGAKCLPRVSFVSHDKPDAFGFISPADVIRSAHIIPAFVHGRTSTLLASPSLARANGKNEEEEDNDWTSAYVNMYVMSIFSFYAPERRETYLSVGL